MAVVTAKDIFRFAACPGDCCPDDEGPGDCDCNCANCSDTAPCCFEVTISGMSNDVCGHCTDLDKTYFLEQTEVNGCEWVCEYIPTLCDTDRIVLTVYLDGADYKIKVEFGRHVWEKNYGEVKPDCCTLVDEELTHQTSSGDCDSSSATCIVAARNSGGCPCIQHQCCSDSVPQQMLLEVVAFDDWQCNDCADFEGNYILVIQDTPPTTLYRLWTHELNPQICGFERWELSMRFHGFGYCCLTLSIRHATPGLYDCHWHELFPAPRPSPCKDIDNFVISPATGTYIKCRFDLSGEVKVTAL